MLYGFDQWLHCLSICFLAYKNCSSQHKWLLGELNTYAWSFASGLLSVIERGKGFDQFKFQVTVHPWGRSGQEFKWELEKEPRREAVCWLPWTLLSNPGPPAYSQRARCFSISQQSRQSLTGKPWSELTKTMTQQTLLPTPQGILGCAKLAGNYATHQNFRRRHPVSLRGSWDQAR